MSENGGGKGNLMSRCSRGAPGGLVPKETFGEFSSGRERCVHRDAEFRPQYQRCRVQSTMTPMCIYKKKCFHGEILLPFVSPRRCILDQDTHVNVTPPDIQKIKRST